MLNGAGAELHDCVISLLPGRYREPVRLAVERTFEWIADGCRGRRSVRSLARSRGERDVLARVAQADATVIETTLMRAQREMSDEPLKVRLGLTEVDKQAGHTDDVWLATDLPRQRGSTRARSGALMLGTSKVVGRPTLPGVTAVIRRGQRPDAAIAQMLRAIYQADPDARILDANFDYFDACLSFRRNETVPHIRRRLPELASPLQASGPLALWLPDEEPLLSTPVEGPARDVLGLRAGRRGDWTDPSFTVVERVDTDGALVRWEVKARITDQLRIGTPAASFRARVVRFEFMRPPGALLAPEPALVAVVGEHDEERIVELAVDALSTADEHPTIANFIRRRADARVFKGEQQSREALHADRAVAAVALAIDLLDTETQAAAVSR